MAGEGRVETVTYNHHVLGDGRSDAVNARDRAKADGCGDEGVFNQVLTALVLDEGKTGGLKAVGCPESGEGCRRAVGHRILPVLS